MFITYSFSNVTLLTIFEETIPPMIDDGRVKIIGMLIAIFSPMYYMKFFDKLDNYPIFSGILLGLIMLIQASLFVFAYNYFFLLH